MIRWPKEAVASSASEAAATSSVVEDSDED